MKLYSYWRSSTSYRVRIALALKGVAYDTVPVNLDDAEQTTDDYRALNPSQAVPTLVTDTGVVLTQSLAIMDYLDATVPEPSLLPGDAVMRARVLAASLVMAMDVHPVNNLRVLGRLKAMGHDQGDCVDWMRHWMIEGFTAFVALIDPDTPYCFAHEPAFADLFLFPPLYHAGFLYTSDAAAQPPTSVLCCSVPSS